MKLCKRIMSLLLAVAMLCGLIPMTVLATDDTEITEKNLWDDKSAVFVGDSITAGTGTTKIYYEYLKESLGFGSVTAMGVPGSCISTASDYGQKNQPLINRYQNVPSADLIVVFMGTNDYGHETPLGSITDSQDGTFYGALNIIIPALVEMHPSSKIVFVTPLHRYGFGTSKILGTKFTYDNIPNGVGATLENYVNAVKNVCKNNGVSVIDLYTESTLDPTEAEAREQYMPDGLHPNAAGHKVIAEIIESHIRSYEPVVGEQVGLTELIYGNKFAPGNNQPCRASSRINYYLKAGTKIILKDTAEMQWACAKTSDEYSSNNLGYFPDKQWTDKETATVAEDGWVGFTFKYRDETQSFDLTKPLSDYITIEEPHTHTYENGICTDCGEAAPSLTGKTISVLGASISTFEGASNGKAADTTNSTIRNNVKYYPNTTIPEVTLDDTWWMQVTNDLDLRLLVNNAWSGSAILLERSGTVGAYVDRCVQLHDDTGENAGETPDIIVIQMGFNDFSYGKSTLGTSDIDYNALITKDGYGIPTTTMEATAIMLDKITKRYPDAEIYMFNHFKRIGQSQSDTALMQNLNASIETVCGHFGVNVVDLYSVLNSPDLIGDGRLHPNRLGMDVISEAVKSAILENTKYSSDTHTVTFDLTNVSADYGANKVVLDGDSFSVNLKANDTLSVTVMMSDQNITDDVYNNGNITIEKVTADVIITAINIHKPQNYRFEFNGTDLESVGKTENILTKKAGTTANGVFSKTRYSLDKAVVLSHNKPWHVEWKCEGTFLNTNGSSGARIFTTTPVNAEYNARYIFKSNTNGLIAMGEKTATGSHNYGIALGDHGIDWTAPHTYRLENRIADDGSNMIWLYVDGKEIGLMTGYYIGTNSQNKTSDWLSGKDFVFSYMGTDTHGFTNCKIEYIDVWEGCRKHTYVNGICTVCGTIVSPYFQHLPNNITGCTNLYNSLVPVKGYYTATKYDTSNGAVLSVVIPVETGDRIAASSFGSVADNMGSVNGIRVTYLLGDKIVTSLSPMDVYNEYTNNGYIIVPDGVDAVCVPWWKPSDSNWLTLSQINKNFAVHIPQTVSSKAPTCTEPGYTAGEICEICNASLGERIEIPPTGHSYNGDICTTCGTINLQVLLDGKYVSILGDSISTFNGYSNNATVNSTISGNGHRYDAGTADTKPGSFCLLESVNDTWWMHFANRSGMKLLVNNSWAGSQVFGGKTSDGRVIPAAYLDRCVNLHDNTLDNNPGNAPINPDVIFVYLGINDYNFNRSKVGTGTVDYAGLVNSDGTYVTPETFGEAYGIMLHKMRNTYPDAQIFVMTLLPENLYSVDKNAWEQHNTYIRAAAEYYDIPLIDLAENCAITWENYSRYMIDKIHPTTAGMKLISNCIEAELASYYKQNPPHTHNYTSVVTAPTCTEQGYTTHTCHCGDSYVADYVDATGHTYENAICIWCAEWNICWEVGTIAAANGANNVNATRIRTLDHLRLSDFAGVCVNVGYQLTWLAYDANKNYIGNGTSSFTGYWQPSGQSIATADIQDLYADAVYFRLALKNISGGNMTLEDAERSGVTFIPFGQALPEPEFEVEYENSTNIGSWQDGAIWNGNLFVLGASGTGVVYDLENLSKLATFSLDSADVLKPHANSVCFGSTYYAPGDEYPLLYVNIYNNYASAEDRMEGTCCAYRISKTDGGFATELVQVIRIGFVEDLSLWKSKENNGDVRPYGNFLVDTDDNKLYAYVMRDASKATRFFKFDLPELTDGIYSETYGCNVVILESADIEGQFDTEYFKYLQGGTYSSGMILSAEGFNSGGSAEPALRIIDLQTGTVSATYYMVNSGLTTEPEVVCVDPTTGLLYYAPADGILRILSIPDVHFHGYTSCVISPTCTEQGYTTHTCACGKSYVSDYLDALGHKFGQYISNDDATVTSDGTKTAVCERDGCKTTDTVPDVGTKLILGDMNNDKLLDTDDAIYLLRHILMPDSYHVKQSANVNGDDVTDTDDAIYLLRHVLLPNSYPLKLTE